MILTNNATECVQTINNIGSTTIKNICDGTTQILPWGSVDWIATSILSVLLFIIGVALVFSIRECMDL